MILRSIRDKVVALPYLCAANLIHKLKECGVKKDKKTSEQVRGELSYLAVGIQGQLPKSEEILTLHKTADH